ncbi:MAG TPA: ABC transporter substrate-binding protein, partial [Chthoniobacterales bacterium]
MISKRNVLAGALTGMGVALAAGGALAAGKYDPGATDTTIKIGNTEAYSGPASAYGVIGKTQAAYFKMINDQGGINGRKIDFISYDDGYSPPKTVEQTRKLVESDEVLLIFNPLGTPTSVATIKYLNGKKIPQLFIAAGGTLFGDHKTYPWSMGFQPNYQGETRIYGKYLHDNYPNGKIAVISANDDFGRDNMKGFREGLADKVGNIVSTATYETSAPTIDSELLKLKSSGADVFVNFTTPKFAAQAIKKLAEIGWKPVHVLHSVSLSVSSVLKPAGIENAKDIVTANYGKDPDDTAWKDDAGMKKYNEFLAKYMPGEDRSNSNIAYGYNAAQAMVKVLELCKDDLTRANVMKQAESLKNVELDMLLPGITLTTSPTDHFPIE